MVGELSISRFKTNSCCSDCQEEIETDKEEKQNRCAKRRRII